MKQTLCIVLLISSMWSHMTYPGPNSIYGSQQGLFIPQVNEIKNISNANDVMYTRFCKAVCMLYVPWSKTCGLNNEVYLNDCQARCDRVSTDQSRLMFNEKCCCNPGSEYIDAQWVLAGTTASGVDPSAAANVVSSSFCVSAYQGITRNGLTPTGGVNVFAIPACLKTCLGIDDMRDLKFLDNTITYTQECDDGY